MKFIVEKKVCGEYESDTIILINNNTWNDYGFSTIFAIHYCDGKNLTKIGSVKIGKSNMTAPDNTVNHLSHVFEKLDEAFFSIAEDIEYYKNLYKLPNDKGFEILIALNDITIRPDIYEKEKEQLVLTNSLFRGAISLKHNEYIEERRRLMAPPVKLKTMWYFFGSTGWEGVDKALFSMQELLFQNDDRYFFNAIATIGRELIKAITNDNYVDELHRDKNYHKTKPNEDQYFAKLSGIVEHIPQLEYVSEEIKEYIKTTIKLVQKFVHKNNINKAEMYICVNSVISLIFQLSCICSPDRCV